MSITDELRHEVANYPFRDNRDFALFEAIADRIDAEHERELMSEYNDGALEVMSGDGYIELPKDADGEYIHIGDRVEDNERVVRIVLTDESWEPTVYIEERPSVLREYFCNEIGHYHDPTVEELLEAYRIECLKCRDELAKGNDEYEVFEAKLEALTNMYATKLRLADNKEEQ